MRRLLFALCVLVLLVAPLRAVGAEQKIGFVNANKVFEQYSAAREAEETFDKELQDLNKQVTQMEQDLQALADTLEARKYLFSEETLKDKRKQLEKKQQDYLKFRQDAEARASQRNDELSQPIIAAIEEATRRIAQQEGFDLVLDAGPGIVVYSKPELDLTDRVLQSLEESRGSAQ